MYYSNFGITRCFKTNQKYTKVSIYLNKLEMYKFKMAKGLQRCLPNEHLDYKENDSPISSSEDQSFSMNQTSWKYSGLGDPFFNAVIFSTRTVFCKFLVSSNSLLNLSRPLHIFNLDSLFFKHNTFSLHQNLLDLVGHSRPFLSKLTSLLKRLFLQRMDHPNLVPVFLFDLAGLEESF